MASKQTMLSKNKISLSFSKLFIYSSILFSLQSCLNDPKDIPNDSIEVIHMDWARDTLHNLDIYRLFLENNCLYERSSGEKCKAWDTGKLIDCDIQDFSIIIAPQV